jgi:uncharacterized sporulation protein YeaH/YhbH (DUF444 family)
VVSGRVRKELKKFLKGKIVRLRPKGGKLQFSIPQIDQPHFLHGDNGEGVGRGKGKKGQVIGQDPQEGDPQVGDEHADGITIQVDLDEVLKVMQEELGLPDLKPKPSEVYEEVKTVYNDISKVGPESLRHTRRTMYEAMKRMAMMGTLGEKKMLPGHSVPMRVITLADGDRRYRQYKEIKIPSSNAVIFFIRDYSGSMDDFRCDIVSDMSWWIAVWIRKFYERVERVYMIHDTEAQEVDEKKFYEIRFGGGTKISCAFEEAAKMLENRFPVNNYNIYVIYFSDGDNWEEDNEKVADLLKKKFPPEVVNMVGFVQICTYNYSRSIKKFIDEQINANLIGKNVRTVTIGDESSDSGNMFGGVMAMDPEDRDEQILNGIKKLFGREKN